MAKLLANQEGGRPAASSLPSAPNQMIRQRYQNLARYRLNFGHGLKDTMNLQEGMRAMATTKCRIEALQWYVGLRSTIYAWSL